MRRLGPFVFGRLDQVALRALRFFSFYNCGSGSERDDETDVEPLKTGLVESGRA